MDDTRKLWAALAALLIASFGVLLWIGTDIFRQAPPVPTRVIGADATAAAGTTMTGAAVAGATGTSAMVAAVEAATRLSRPRRARARRAVGPSPVVRRDIGIPQVG